MSRPSRPSLLAVVALLAASAIVLGVVLATSSGGPSPSSGAPSSHGIESILQDDQYLLDAPAPVVDRTLHALRILGVDAVRANVLWASLAPAPAAMRAPAPFRAADPSAYPAAGWAPYDRLVRLAGGHGLRVYFTVTGPGPRWAMGAGPAAVAGRFNPSPTRFGAFVRALGRRYDGSYRPPGASTVLPRVDMWSIWNEPNQPGWLAPQWQFRNGQRLTVSPRLYRRLLDAAYAGLTASGHTPSRDTILIGELAPEGCLTTSGAGCSYAPTLEPIPPIDFLQGLYCVDSRELPLTGTPARALGCPLRGRRSAFVRAHPALFDASGFAHHPYSFFQPPSTSLPQSDFVPLANLSRLEMALDGAFSRYGVRRLLPVYVTEFGEATDPPNPYRGVGLRLQAAYLDQALYMAWHDPRVRSMAQFLVYDSLPDRAFPRGSVRYWSTFQTGLAFANGRPKPSLSSYRLPVYLPTGRPVSRGQVVVPRGPTLVWAMLRAAPNGTVQHAAVQWRAHGGRYRTLVAVRTGNPTGVLETRVTLPGSGYVRIVWPGPSGTVSSRVVSVAVG